MSFRQFLEMAQLRQADQIPLDEYDYAFAKALMGELDKAFAEHNKKLVAAGQEELPSLTENDYISFVAKGLIHRYSPTVLRDSKADPDIRTLAINFTRAEGVGRGQGKISLRIPVHVDVPMYSEQLVQKIRDKGFNPATIAWKDINARPNARKLLMWYHFDKTPEKTRYFKPTGDYPRPKDVTDYKPGFSVPLFDKDKDPNIVPQGRARKSDAGRAVTKTEEKIGMDEDDQKFIDSFTDNLVQAGEKRGKPFTQDEIWRFKIQALAQRYSDLFVQKEGDKFVAKPLPATTVVDKDTGKLVSVHRVTMWLKINGIPRIPIHNVYFDPNKLAQRFEQVRRETGRDYVTEPLYGDEPNPQFNRLGRANANFNRRGREHVVRWLKRGYVAPGASMGGVSLKPSPERLKAFEEQQVLYVKGEGVTPNLADSPIYPGETPKISWFEIIQRDVQASFNLIRKTLKNTRYSQDEEFEKYLKTSKEDLISSTIGTVLQGLAGFDKMPNDYRSESFRIRRGAHVMDDMIKQEYDKHKNVDTSGNRGGEEQSGFHSEPVAKKDVAQVPEMYKVKEIVDFYFSPQNQNVDRRKNPATGQLEVDPNDSGKYYSYDQLMQIIKQKFGG